MLSCQAATGVFKKSVLHGSFAQVSAAAKSGVNQTNAPNRFKWVGFHLEVAFTGIVVSLAADYEFVLNGGSRFDHGVLVFNNMLDMRANMSRIG